MSVRNCPLASGSFVAWRTNQSNVSFDNLRVTGSPGSYNTLVYLHGDHLGSIGAVTTSSGALLDMTRFLPFGGYRGSDPAFLTERGFTGHKMNNTSSNDLGLIYMNARYYVGSIGRFASADTLVPDPTNPQQFNRYTYSLNNPIRYFDPTGHCVFGLPCPQPVRDGLNAVVDFSVGALAQWTYDNSFHLNADLAPSPHESTAMTAGRIVGGLDAMAQGIAEMVAGISSMGGGAAACGTGALCVAGAPAIVAGEVIAAHGAGVTATSIAGLVENVANMISSGSGSSGNMHQLGPHFNKHGRSMGYGSKSEYNQAAHDFARVNEQNPDAQIFEGIWNGRGRFNGQTQRAIIYDNKTVIVDVSSGQIIDFYEGTDLRGLINVQEILP